MNLDMTRRGLLRRAVAAGSLAGIGGASPLLGWADVLKPRHTRGDDAAQEGSGALALAQLLNPTTFEDLPRLAIEYAKMIIASTLASAASGSLIQSARILRELAVEHGGRPEATIWFDGTRLPAHQAARVNAVLSDASASDDSDLRNVAHCGTALTSVGLSVAERTGATPRDLLLAMVLGYEAAGRIGEARVGGRGGVHASQIVAFGGTVAASKLLNLTDEQMAHALGITAVTQGGLSIGTNSWAREYMAANAATCAVNSALAAGRGFAVSGDLLDPPRGFAGVYGGGNAESLTRDLREWDIVRYLAVKLWPGAHPFSGTVEAAVNAARQANAQPEEVRQILVSGRNRTSVGGSRRPRDLIEAIHSLPYFVASAVADRDFSWVHATPEKIFSPVAERLMNAVQLDPSPPAVRYEWSWGGTVTIVTDTGDRFTSTVHAPRGSAPRGIEWSDVEAKYRALMPDSGLSSDRTEQVLGTIRGLDGLDELSELTTLLV